MARRRAPVFGAPALLLVVAVSTVLASGSAASPSAWRRPVALVPPGGYTFAPRLAVAADGQMIAGLARGRMAEDVCLRRDATCAAHAQENADRLAAAAPERDEGGRRPR